jgi:protein-export membrane protein SecD
MFENTKVRLGVIALIALVSGVLLWRNYDRTSQIVTLGLDLQGGTHLALEIDESSRRFTAAQREDAIDRALKIVRIRVDQMGVSEPVVQKVGNDRIIVELAGVDEAQDPKGVIQRAAFLEFKILRPGQEFQNVLTRLDRAVAAAFPDEARTAPDAPAAAPVDPLFRPAPEDAPATQDGDGDEAPDAAGEAGEDAAALPALDGPTGQAFTSRMQGFGNEGQLLVQVADTSLLAGFLRHPDVRASLPRGAELLWGVPEAERNPGMRSLWLVNSTPMITGEYLQNATAQTDQFGRPIVSFELNRRGGRIFERETGRHIGEQMAIVLDEQVYTAPVIRSQIGSRGQIELGRASLDEATNLALVLRAGALPAPLRIVEERTVGPTLGQDSVDRGVVAGMIGIALVILVMLAYYRLAGVMAVTALGLYSVYVMGSLAAMNAVLTLPGIAGLILSVGMAVDANVLIFERIREELAAGRPVRPAVNEGFQNAISAIVDSNITTLITAGILFYFGTGPVRGFAVTLAIGIVASMFTALFVTRTFFTFYLEQRSSAAKGMPI